MTFTYDASPPPSFKPIWDDGGGKPIKNPYGGQHTNMIFGSEKDVIKHWEPPVDVPTIVEPPK